MKKLIFLLFVISFTAAPAQKIKPVTPVSTENADAVLLSKTKYRLIGPFRGGRSAAVTGTHFTSVPPVGVFGKQPMEVVTGKIFLINTMAAPSEL
jgi:hypothetical protein